MEQLENNLKSEIVSKPTNRLILAPMVRIGSTPFRLLSLKYGADLVFTEETIAKKLRFSEKKYNEDLNTNDYLSIKDGSLVLRTHPDEKGKLILQIGASEPEDALQAALVAKDDIVGVDVNMGCPKHFSTHGNMGSALLLLPELAKQILEHLIKYSGLPVSCKIRLLEDKENTRNFIEAIQSTGIQFFTIHLRKKDQPAKFKANWKALFDIQKYAKIPFNVNGDILSPLDIYKLQQLHICDGFMLARGAIHNPKIFEEFKNFSLEDYLLNSDINFSNEEFNLDNDYEEVCEEKDNKDLNCNHQNKKKEKDDDIKVSNKLSKVFEKKYNKQVIDIIPIIKDYIELALRTGNYFHNSKYNTLYILKTHKKHLDLFKKIQSSKNYLEVCKHLGMEDLYEEIIKYNGKIKQYYDGSFYKNRFKQMNINKEINNTKVKEEEKK